MKFNVQDLIDKGLVKKKTYTEGVYKGLSVLKYSRKVFYDNLWYLDARLLECRGMVVDEDWNIIVRPFKKVFNYGENNTTVAQDEFVQVIEKINGFMAAVTMTEKYGLIISTTGTLDSEFANLASKWIVKGGIGRFVEGNTYLFEICDDSDPHIVKEVEGAYLIGIRDVENGTLAWEKVVDFVAHRTGYLRPNYYSCMLFSKVPDTLKEGYIIRSRQGDVLCKLKSKHYLSKKMLQRCGKNKASFMWNNPVQFKQRLDEEFYNIYQNILDNFIQEDYLELTEQERREYIENYFEENKL